MEDNRTGQAEVQEGGPTFAGGGGEEEADGEADVPHTPLVFQCAGCRHVVGDSFSFVCADQTLGMVCLSAVTGQATMAKCSVLSSSGPDEGWELTCKTCKEYKLGKIYKATPKQYVHMQELYSLDTEAITSYVLGSAEQWADGEILERLPSIQHMRSLNGELMKLQHVLVGIDERLQSLEMAAQDKDPGMARYSSGDAAASRPEQNGVESTETAKRKREN